MNIPSKDGTTFSRTIKLLVANLDKTKERIQEKFLLVDERLNQLENSITSINQKVNILVTNNEKTDSITDKGLVKQVISMIQRIENLEKTIKELHSQEQSIITPTPVTIESPKHASESIADKKPSQSIPAPFPSTSPSSIPEPATSQTKITEKPNIIADPVAISAKKDDKSSKIPAPASKTAIPSPSSTKIPTPSVKTAIPSPLSTKIPTPPTKRTIPAPKTEDIKSISIPSVESPKAKSVDKLNEKSPVSTRDDKTEREQLLEALKQLDGI